MCDPSNVDEWRHIVKSVDVVIDCVGGEVITTVPYSILDAVIDEAAKARPDGPPLSYIYCSGTWVHGSDKSERKSDMTPLNDPLPLTSWRLGIENKAINAISRSFTANVVRPSLIYGAPGHSLVGMVFFPGAKNGTIVVPGVEDARVATIHREDLGEAFRLVGEKVSSLCFRSLIFH